MSSNNANSYANSDSAIIENGNSVENKIIKIVSDLFNKAEGEVTEHSKIADDLGADSLDAVELMMSIEDAFECKITDEEASKITTVSEIIKFVENHLATSKTSV